MFKEATKHSKRDKRSKHQDKEVEELTEELILA